jgi:hypothetical protein
MPHTPIPVDQLPISPAPTSIPESLAETLYAVKNDGRIFGVSKKLTALGVIYPAQLSAVIALVPDEYTDLAIATCTILTGLYLLSQTVVDIYKILKNK